jgi:hypothetical protein
MAILVWPVVVYHPYEVTYFNSFIGGLGGAQRRALFTMPSPHDYRSGGTEGDYWYSSFRDALRTIHANTMGRTDFSVATCDPIVAKSYTALEWEAPPLPMLSVDPAHADYVVVIPRAGYCPPKVVTDLEAARPRLTRVEREGGIIYEVLAPPR